MMDLRRLQTFAEVVRRGSFAAAAQALSYAPSAVSQQMSALERELGAPLFERTGRNVRPSAAGEVLAEHVAQIEVALNEARAAVRAVGGLVSGEIRLASFPSAGAVLVPSFVRAFRSAHPSVRITVAEAEPGVALEWLADRTVDAALVYDYDHATPTPPASLVLETLLTDPMRLITAAGGPTRAVALSTFADAAWIAGAPDSPGTHLTTRVCRAAGFEPDIRYRTEDYLVMQRLVASGAGVAFVPGLALIEPAADVRVRALTDAEPARRVHAARRGGAPSATVAAAMQQLAAAASALGTGQQR